MPDNNGKSPRIITSSASRYLLYIFAAYIHIYPSPSSGFYRHHNRFNSSHKNSANMFYALLLGVPVAWIAYTAACIVTNLRRARPLKVPVVIVPISPMNALWMMLERILQSRRQCSRLAHRVRFFDDNLVSVSHNFPSQTECEAKPKYCLPPRCFTSLQQSCHAGVPLHADPVVQRLQRQM